MTLSLWAGGGSCRGHRLADLWGQTAAYSSADSSATPSPAPQLWVSKPHLVTVVVPRPKCCLSFVSSFVVEQPDGHDARVVGAAVCVSVSRYLVCGVSHAARFDFHSLSISTQLMMFAKLKTLSEGFHLFLIYWNQLHFH